MLGLPTMLAVGDQEVFLIIAVAVIAAVVVLCTVSSIRKVLETRAKEQTKREVAAYVAEGTISAADAVRLLGSKNEEAEKMIADGVAWGMIKPEKADALIRALRSGDGAMAPAAKG